MTLQVDVEAGIVGRVVLRGGEPGLPVEGRTEAGDRWTVAPQNPVYPITDPAAPLNTPIFYQCGEEQAEAVVRSTEEYNAFTSLDGGVVVPFIMPHSWEEGVDTGLLTIQTAGGGFWHSYVGEEPQPRPYPVEARVEGEHIATMRKLVREQRPLVFLHAPCPLPFCPVPSSLICVVKEVPGKVTGRKDLGEIIFSLSLQPLEHTAPVAARSWWDTMNNNDSWFGVDVIDEFFK